MRYAHLGRRAWHVLGGMANQPEHWLYAECRLHKVSPCACIHVLACFCSSARVCFPGLHKRLIVDRIGQLQLFVVLRTYGSHCYCARACPVQGTFLSVLYAFTCLFNKYSDMCNPMRCSPLKR